MYSLKRKLKTAEDTINHLNVRKCSDSSALTINKEKLFSQELRIVKMSNILLKLPSKVKVCNKSCSYVEYLLTRPSGNKFKTVRLKNINFENLFTASHFMANVNHVFNCSITDENFRVKLFPKLNFKIEIDEPCLDSQINVLDEDKSEFMFLVCMFFGMCFNITIDKCICHPSSFQDFMMLDAGITKNCISSECVTQILIDPFLYDPLIHYDCSQKSNNNSLFLGLNLHSPQDISVNITSTQLIDEK